MYIYWWIDVLIYLGLFIVVLKKVYDIYVKEIKLVGCVICFCNDELKIVK